MKNAGHSDRLLWQAHRTIGAVANRFGPVGGVGFWWMIVMALFCCRDKTLKAQSVRDESSKIIRTVRVEGNKAVSSSVILGKNKSRAGAKFNEKLVDEDARRIVALPEILDIRWQARPVDGKIDLVFIVTESPQITEIEFVGNKHVTADELNKEIDFRVGEFLDAYLIKNSAQAIAELYRKKGYYSVRVEVDENLMETTRKIRYIIVEGPKLRIRKVEFQAEPRQSISTMKLKSLVKSRAYFPILNSGLLDDRQLEQDRLAIANHYHSQGFLDARVFVQTQMNDERTRGTLRFVIEEGLRYQVVSIRFEGNAAFSDEKLNGALTLETGDVLTQERNIKAIRALQRLYGGQGYVYVRVRLEPEFTDHEGEVVAVFKIDEGSAYRLGRLVIRGNTQTQDKVIRREYDRYGFLPSGLYDTVAMDRATRRLRGSRLFENVGVTPIGNDPNERDALVEVKETLTGLISFGIGISTDGRIGGRFKREEQNFDISRWPRSLGEIFQGKSFRGGGQYMSIDFFPSTRETTGRIRFREPYLFDQPNYFNLDLFMSRRWQESYIERRRGGRMTVGHRFENDWSVDMSLRAERVIIRRRSSRWFGLSDPSDPLSPIIVIAPQDVQDVEGGNTITSVKLGVGRDVTDIPFRPTQGYKFNTSWEQYGAMGGEYAFGSFGAGGTWYIPVHEDILERRTVLALRVQYNQIVGDAPVFERFYAGHLGSIRGFEYRGVSPRAGRQRDPIGSEFLFLAGAEMSAPLYEETIYAKLFCDTALLEEGPYRVSVGFGLEMIIPQMNQPIQINFGVPIVFDDEDEKQAVSFSFGYIF